MTDLENLKRDCWEKAINSFGTAYIFERRTKSLRIRLRILAFLGIAVPALVGLIVISYGAKSSYIDLIFFIAGLVAIIQLAGSIWALVSSWEDNYSYSKESTSSNYSLSKRYKGLATSTYDITEFNTHLKILNIEDEMRSSEDYKHSITDKEKRMGMRAALRSFQKKCAACQEVPTEMIPSKCGVCGNF